MVFECPSCNKNYQRKDLFNRHKVFCEFLYKTKKENDKEEEELEKIPSLPELFDIVKELTIKYNKLQKDNEILKQNINNRKKKINVIDWLNNNNKPDLTFKRWTDNICLEDKDLNYMFTYGNIDGTLQILQDICAIDTMNLPIKCFNQKINTFYVYDVDEENEETNWKIISTNELKLFFKNINNRVINLFKDWQEKNIYKLDNDDFAITYIQNVRKLLGKDESLDIEFIKLKSKFYKYLKTNIKTIIEYDFS